MSTRKVTLVDLDGNYVAAGGGGGSSNITQWNGNTVSLGAGAVDAGTLRTTLAAATTVGLAAGAAAIGSLTAGTANIGNVQPIPGTSGGLLVSSNLIPNNNTAIVIKASAGQLYGIRCYVNSSVIAYIKAYNATSATAGSGTPVDRHMIPAPAAGGGGGLIWADAQGVAFSVGITVVVVTDFADNGTTAPAANSYIVNFYYK